MPGNFSDVCLFIKKTLEYLRGVELEPFFLLLREGEKFCQTIFFEKKSKEEKSKREKVSIIK